MRTRGLVVCSLFLSSMVPAGAQVFPVPRSRVDGPPADVIVVDLDEDVKQSWAQVQSAYQRRAELIPNLVSTVQGYADFEQETLTRVIEARQQVTNVNVDPESLTAENFAQFQQASLKGRI